MFGSIIKKNAEKLTFFAVQDPFSTNEFVAGQEYKLKLALELGKENELQFVIEDADKVGDELNKDDETEEDSEIESSQNTDFQDDEISTGESEYEDELHSDDADQIEDFSSTEIAAEMQDIKGKLRRSNRCPARKSTSQCKEFVKPGRRKRFWNSMYNKLVSALREKATDSNLSAKEILRQFKCLATSISENRNGECSCGKKQLR